MQVISIMKRMEQITIIAESSTNNENLTMQDRILDGEKQKQHITEYFIYDPEAVNLQWPHGAAASWALHSMIHFMMETLKHRWPNYTMYIQGLNLKGIIIQTMKLKVDVSFGKHHKIKMWRKAPKLSNYRRVKMGGWLTGAGVLHSDGRVETKKYENSKLTESCESCELLLKFFKRASYFQKNKLDKRQEIKIGRATKSHKYMAPI